MVLRSRTPSLARVMMGTFVMVFVYERIVDFTYELKKRQGIFMCHYSIEYVKALAC